MHVVHVFHEPSWSFPSTEYSWFSYQSTFLFATVLGNSSVNASRSLIYHGGYSVTINKFQPENNTLYQPLEELLTKLSGGEKFTKIDLSQAYH